MNTPLQNIIKIANDNKHPTVGGVTPIIIDTQGIVNNKIGQTIGNAINNYTINKAKDFYNKMKPETINKNPYWINNWKFFDKHESSYRKNMKKK
jgi:hypothetical protein